MVLYSALAAKRCSSAGKPFSLTCLDTACLLTYSPTYLLTYCRSCIASTPSATIAQKARPYSEASLACRVRVRLRLRVRVGVRVGVRARVGVRVREGHQGQGQGQGH